MINTLLKRHIVGTMDHIHGV